MSEKLDKPAERLDFLKSDFKRLNRNAWKEDFSFIFRKRYTPLQFAGDVLSEKFDVPVNIRKRSMITAPNWLDHSIKRYSLLDDYYRFNSLSILDPINESLFEFYGIDQEERGPFYSFLEKELEIFRGVRRKNGSLQYIHQLQVAATVAGYMNYHENSILKRVSRLFNGSRPTFSDEERLIILYSALGHDTPEDAFPKGTPFSSRMESFRQELSLEDRIAEKVADIVGALTRINEEGKEIEYQATAQKISSMEDNRARSIAFMDKLADRIVNMKTLGNLGKQRFKKGDPKPNDPEWHIKNVYKTYVMLAEVREQLPLGIDKDFRPIIESMYHDLLYIARDELKLIKRHYIRSNKFEIETKIESRLTDPIDFMLTRKELKRETANWSGTIPYGIINYSDGSNNGAYGLVGHRRQFPGYLDKLRSLVRARRNYRTYILGGEIAQKNSWEELQRENEAKKVRYIFDGIGTGIRLIHDENLISDRPETADSSILDRFDSHFEAKILEKGAGEIPYEEFFVHLLSERWIYAYKLKSQVENEFQDYRFKNGFGKKPFSNLGYEELIRQERLGISLQIGEIPSKQDLESIYDSDKEIREQSKILFGYAQCEYLDDMLQTLKLNR